MMRLSIVCGPGPLAPARRSPRRDARRAPPEGRRCADPRVARPWYVVTAGALPAGRL